MKITRGRDMNNFTEGTVFIVNESKRKMKIIKIEEHRRSSGNVQKVNRVAVIQDIKSKAKTCCGLDVLENSDITVVS